MQITLTPEIILAAYSQGIFPMAENAHTPYVRWICPEKRGQLSISEMHISRSLKKSVRHMKISGHPYDLRINTDFRGVITACAAEHSTRPQTWINPPILEVFCTLHQQGHAHSVECWQSGELVGGLYGLALGGAFFGESMFSRTTDASKVCLVHLVARLWAQGFVLLDTQFVNEHLRQFGVYELRYKNYMKRLECALAIKANFTAKTPAFLNEQTLVNAYLDERIPA